MKYLILVPDGMTDWPMESGDFRGKTPLEVAFTPNMDLLAARSKIGLANTVPTGFTPGSDVANLAIMGFDPRMYYTGRGPLEAASMGIELAGDAEAWRCNLVTITDGKMEDFTASHIASEEAREIIHTLNQELGSDEVKFYSGVSYRHLCVFSRLGPEIVTTPPHDITAQAVANYLPEGDNSPPLMELMEKARGLLANHPVNKKRREKGKREANSIWIWGGGKSIPMPTLKEKYNLSGAVISAVDLIKGIGRLAGMEVIEVPGATGYLDTNFEGKARYGLKALEVHDILYLHVEAPDEAGHMGAVAEKIKAIEDFDRLVLGTILKETENWADFRLLCLPDHATPVKIMTHSSDAVPYFLYQKSRSNNGVANFNEKTVRALDVETVFGWGLLDILVSV